MLLNGKQGKGVDLLTPFFCLQILEMSIFAHQNNTYYGIKQKGR